MAHSVQHQSKSQSTWRLLQSTRICQAETACTASKAVHTNQTFSYFDLQTKRDAVYCNIIWQMFRKHILPPSSGYHSPQKRQLRFHQTARRHIRQRFPNFSNLVFPDARWQCVAVPSLFIPHSTTSHNSHRPWPPNPQPLPINSIDPARWLHSIPYDISARQIRWLTFLEGNWWQTDRQTDRQIDREIDKLHVTGCAASEDYFTGGVRACVYVCMYVCMSVTLLTLQSAI
jgi:hypothetical protein